MIKKQDQVSPFMVFFIVVSAQLGVGVLSFQSEIAKYAGHDAWMSIILAGITMNIVIWMMYQIMNKEKTDLVAINCKVYGKWIGSLLSMVFSLYLIFLAALILRIFIEVIQVWMFPFVNIWGLLLAILPLVYYIISGGFRTIVGVCFFGVAIPSFLIFTLFFPLPYSHATKILPIFDHSLMELISSAPIAVFNLLGTGVLLVYYPFISEARKSQVWAHLGNVFSTAVYTVVSLVTFAYFTHEQLKELIWPTLMLWKIIELPFMDRFEYIGIATWFYIILPNISLYLWGGSRIVKRITTISQERISIFFLLVIFVFCLLLDTWEQIMSFSSGFPMWGSAYYTSMFRFWFCPILLWKR
ncbi:spore germination protein [Halobacillus shinanisalinarum]|uniref:Spore germination protein n=1 Tax=Halobacillus shinanisalinarum TaxID=2932258 RepID=A0ABY4GZ79_9BACI|nr:GerAB/ArcD/ProY family transporter [Halobacillus shinanisalinarum]UOQ93369.1 spore germination protein [Halobacillus shinanisalinarum]